MQGAVDALDGDVRWRLTPDPLGGEVLEVGGRFIQLVPGAVVGIGLGD